MTNRLVIRKADINDIKNIAVLKQQVWISTYAVEGIRTEFSNYVLSEFTLKNIQETILDMNKMLLIAQIDNHIIGCVEIDLKSKCPIPLEQDYPEITVLYVLERFSGIGTGSKLLIKALSELKKMNFKSTWLTVYHENERAIKFYMKRDFKMIGVTDFEMDGNKYENKVMLVEIE